MDKIRLLLVDDQEIVRQGLATILHYAPDIEVVGQASNGEEAIQRTQEMQPAVILMDIKMPRLGGIPATRRILESWPLTRIIILTTYDADDLVYEGIRAGASGYLLKDSSSETLLQAIRGVVQGQSQLDPNVARKVLEAFQRLATAAPRQEPSAKRAERQPIEPITAREEEILRLLMEGLANKEIGERLHLSEGTVKNYVSVIIDKLQASDRTQAVVKALRLGIVEL